MSFGAWESSNFETSNQCTTSFRPSARRRIAPKLESSNEMYVLHSSYFSSTAEMEIANYMLYIIKLSETRKKKICNTIILSIVYEVK